MNKIAENLIHYKKLFTKYKTLRTVTNMDTHIMHTTDLTWSITVPSHIHGQMKPLNGTPKRWN